MGIEFWIVPVIAAGVFILGSLLRNREEERKQGRRGPGDDAGQLRRRSSTDLDRFLEEARRRRQMGETPPAPPPRPVERPVSRPRIETPVTPQRRRPPQPKAQPAATPRRASRPGIPQVIAVAEPVLEAVPVLEHLPPSLRAPPAPPSAPARPDAPTGAVVSRPTVSAPLAPVAALLRSPKGLRAAFVLQEVLGPPLSRRRPGTPPRS